MSDERARLFVALDLPAAVRGELVTWATKVVAGQPGMRLVAEESLHVTLCFLGWRDLEQAESIAKLALPCARRAPELRTGEAAWLPPRRPGVLVADLDDEDEVLGAMQACVVDALEDGIGYEPEKRPFRPHVTVARLRRGARPPRGHVPPPPAMSFTGEGLTLYRSRLQREGARYEALARASF